MEKEVTELSPVERRKFKAMDKFVDTCLEHGMSPELTKLLWEMAFNCGGLDNQMRSVSELDKLKHTFDSISRKWNLLSILPLVIGAIVLVALFTSCGKLTAGNQPSAESVFTTEVDYKCFIVRDEEGRAVGGNCVHK